MSFSKSDIETRFLVREVILVEEQDVEESSAEHMKIKSISYVRAIKKSTRTGQGFIFVHSHSSGSPNHSIQDDIEEGKLFHTVYQRIPDSLHASIVFSDHNKPIARVWLADGTITPVSVIRSIGHRFHFFSNGDDNPHPEFSIDK